MITLWEYLRRAAEKSSGQAREKEEQRSPLWGTRLTIPLPVLPPAEDAAAVRTLFLLLWRFGQAPPHPSRRVGPTLLPLACRLRLCFLVSSLTPAITQHPLVAPGGRTLHILAHLYSLKLLKTLPSNLRAIHPLLHGFCRV
ncbi:hypothetical protein XENOCAPTIV_012748 [Xenoophorus captivus]|uniref:Uncharacterized protein n=1 Tax=Xenoophorus captivus TaxID=1517983 RepID=A0ABV0QHZ1_9TELE